VVLSAAAKELTETKEEMIRHTILQTNEVNSFLLTGINLHKH
jgi:hypothetical protein